MELKFDEKISKAFAKFETIVSFFVDKIAFHDVKGIPKVSSSTDESESEKLTEKII